jgi:hypothetical protein
MRVYWHQAGIHVLPESDAEREALLLIWESIKRGKPPELDIHHLGTGKSAGTPLGGSVVLSENVRVAD